MCYRHVTKIGTDAEMFKNDYINLLFTFIIQYYFTMVLKC